MGYSHNTGFSAGSSGYAVGAKGSETQIIDSSGAFSIPAEQGLSVGEDDSGADVTFYGDTSGSYLLWDTSTDDLKLNAAQLVFTGTPNTKLISGGSYSSMLAHQGSELVTVAAAGAADGWYLGYGCYIRATGEDGKAFGFCATLEATNTTGIDRMQAGQFISLLGTAGGSEAAILKTRDGDGTAGLFGSWHKIGGNTNCTAASGSRMAAVWLDNQFHGTASGDEYTIFSSTGGSVPDGWACLNTSSSGWSNLFVFDSTMTGKNPIGAAVDTDGGNSDISIKIEYNGTTYYIPAFTASGLA